MRMVADPISEAERTNETLGLGGISPDGATPSRTPGIRIALGLAAAILVILAWRLPIWEARLSAPQYPLGLSLTAGGRGVSGDIREINELNHYVGMAAFDPSDAPETVLWGWAILMALVAVVVATVLDVRNPLARLARIGLWLIPLGALADVQYRLHQYGHNVQPDAPIRLDPFTPLVVGPTKVLNFTTWSFPGGAIWCLFGAAFLMSFGAQVIHWGRERWATRPIYVNDEEIPA
jgi:copper chaperone NosL